MSIVAADAATHGIAPPALAKAVDAALSAPPASHAVDIGGGAATARLLLALGANSGHPHGIPRL